MDPFYDLTNMTWPEVKDALATVKIAIIPIGAHEQHGPHMVESCDAVLAAELAKKLAARLYPQALVTPCVNMGVSPHHMGFPGTLSLKPETLLAILRDMIESLQHHGINHVLLLNAHGGNAATLNLAADRFSRELGVHVYNALTSSSVKPLLRHKIESSVFGHSCEWEVSEALYLAPHLVRKDKLEKAKFKEGNWKYLRPGNVLTGSYDFDVMTENGCTGDATKASSELGEEISTTALEHLTAAVRQILA
jgi:creatinine amidohydrolase